MGKDMDLNFEIFMIVLLVLSIVVVGNFLRDGESNYLEGALLIVCLEQCLPMPETNFACRLYISSSQLRHGTTRILMSLHPTESKAYSRVV
jgi:hypothetical protein